MKTFLIALILFFYTGLLFAQEDTYITTSARVAGVSYKAIYKSSDWSISIVKNGGKVVLHLGTAERYDEGFSSFKFVDFNGDGYQDLLIEYMSNIPGRCDLLMYNGYTRSFELVKDFPNYPVPKRLRGTGLYYSYSRGGCADADWNSDLFKVVNNKIVKMGNMCGQGCGDGKTGIYIFKMRGTKKTQVKAYPINDIYKHKNNKWGFIKEYWSRNYRRFM
ncbi:hypothetical protein LX99_00512 [Mucilaginibacter oryzae]|uniref:VCBS repeat protein n=1 Tax=Mucilaginibacter oryzae TaxID=468058 RepID=A0A316HHE0_9SPHI|nr:hypothetical protein [Mucilaginibacter oryzae]PWK80048.1 hypothetical protein LX99_00512 [Mucilaginibacter oryzae]